MTERTNEAADVEMVAEEGQALMSGLITELRAIRTLLEQRERDESRCPHGGTGVCMSCVTPLLDYHLGVMANGITNEVWAAMRRG